ncbi:MAG: DUF4143 domain-containing protein, partial [Gammaproteobacteria bacterium]
DWQKTTKRLLDSGELKNIFSITTGSKAIDLRRGIERLPGRKGKLSKTEYIFTPVAYKNFKKKCGDFFKEDALFAYILSGGSPVGINALAETGRLPDYITSIINDWVFGEFAAHNRSRTYLLAILQSIFRMAGNPVGQSKLAKESGMANNTIAQGYINLLTDLMIVLPSFPYDADRKISIFRKPCKYHFTNLLAAITWHPKKPRTIAELKNLGPDLGFIMEWVVAQEIWRQSCIHSFDYFPEILNFWQSKTHEIDFVIPNNNQNETYIEVKLRPEQASNFLWFFKSFPNPSSKLLVINKNNFTSERIMGINVEEFLLSKG